MTEDRERETVALIPVREGSQRVEKKNFRPFVRNESLLDLKIGQLKAAACFDRIYVSSAGDLPRRAAEKAGVEFLERGEEYCNSTTPWAEVVAHIVGTIPGDPVVVWALATSPLFERFAGALERFRDHEECDSLVAVLPRKAFFLNQHGRGINYNPGLWHPYSQQLETYYEVTGACYIGRRSDMAHWRYWFGVKPHLFPVSFLESVDVDTPDDFESARKIHLALSSSAAQATPSDES